MPEFAHGVGGSPPMPGARLLPWRDSEGRPAYLAAGSEGGTLARLADAVEAGQLRGARAVLEHAAPILANQHATSHELRFAGERLAECLSAVLRVAHSRGRRLDVHRDEQEPGVAK
jgi:hypothetical protein